MNTDSSNLTLAIEYLKSARSLLGSELIAMFHEADRLDPRTVSLAEGITGLSDVITKLDSDFLRNEYIVRLSDNKGVVIQERYYAQDLGQALRWSTEMREGFSGLTFEASIEER